MDPENDATKEIETPDDDVSLVSANVGLGRRFRAEICCAISLFGTMDSNGKVLDLDASFCIRRMGGWKSLIVKFICFVLITSTLITGINDEPSTRFFLAYVSCWTLVWSVVYITLSLFVSIFSNPPAWAINATWFMFSVAAVHGPVITYIFWTAEYAPSTYDLKYSVIMMHGPTWALVLLDGFLVSKIPVRLMHYWICFFFGILFLCWSLIQAFLPVDNPYKDGDANGGDESLYDVLDWNNDPVPSAGLSVLLLLIAFPVIQILLWMMSLPGRRYIQESDSGETADPHEQEQPGSSSPKECNNIHSCEDALQSGD